MSENRESVELSIVVAAPDAGPSLARCVASLRAQVSAPRAEILVIDSSRSGLINAWPDSAGIRVFRSADEKEVPRLWQLGIDASKGRVIALLVESCVPAADWAAAVLRAQSPDWAVIGGAIDLSPTCGLVDSAIYFCRYFRYMPSFAAQSVDDLPGTNCCYKRAALDSLREEMTEGFWETFIHRQMRNRGDKLLCDPTILVRYEGSNSGGSFFRVRFLHGRRFASRRARKMNFGQRILRAIAFPVVPLVILRRIAGSLWEKRRYRARFVLCLPFLVFFLASWSVGEFVGYLRAPSRQSLDKNQKKTRLLNEVG